MPAQPPVPQSSHIFLNFAVVISWLFYDNTTQHNTTASNNNIAYVLIIRNEQHQLAGAGACMQLKVCMHRSSSPPSSLVTVAR